MDVLRLTFYRPVHNYDLLLDYSTSLNQSLAGSFQRNHHIVCKLTTLF